MTWKPDAKTIASWGSDKSAGYFEWLRAQPQLPHPSEVPSVAAAPRMLVDLVRTYHNVREWTQDPAVMARWRAGEYTSLYHLECHEEIDAERDQRAAKDSAQNEYREVIRSLLAYGGEITEELISESIERINQKQPYMGPMA